MKPKNNLLVLAGLCLAFVLSPLTVQAQTTPQPTTTTAYDRGDHDRADYGWIGLLGLLGLGGLMRKKDDDRRYATTESRTDVRGNR